MILFVSHPGFGRLKPPSGEGDDREGGQGHLYRPGLSDRWEVARRRPEEKWEFSNNIALDNPFLDDPKLIDPA